MDEFDGVGGSDGVSLSSVFDRRVRISPRAPAVRDVGGEPVSWGELGDRVTALAADLAARGVRPATVVSWQLPTSVEAIVLLLALCRLGATQNPLLPVYGDRELDFILRQARPALLIVDGADPARTATARRVAAAVARDGEPIDVLAWGEDSPGQGGPLAPPTGTTGRWYFYTSGTTSAPKGVVHADRAVLAAGRTLVDRLGLRPDDRYGAVFPLCHVGGPAWQVAAMLVGFETLCVERFTDEAITALHDFDVTIAGAGPPFFLAYLAAQRALPAGRRLFPRVRAFPGGGTGRPHDLHARMVDAFGAGIIPSYGLTEAPIVCMGRLGDSPAQRATTEGIAAPRAQLRVTTPDGAAAPVGSDGEIQIRGDHLMVGYLDPELTAAAMTPDGWLRTGDLGRLDAAGYLTVTGRIKDVIIRNMENVSAVEVEQVLATHPDVADVSVIGLPDERTGERVCAVVVPTAAGTPPGLADLTDWCARAGLMKQKWPERLELIDELPRNPVGKVTKAQLRRRYLAGGEADAAAPR
ncbi:class I adenylate-forming enzyme family protein [Frankia sp. QA3]|uniref:class I adenylate-forming enzyme family protein n=1 Tax=Frankia sp. QA3 TaxID=710111 RepID=UPI000269BF1A|nr:class I adenylate-forming enzyme family protein [Frankia sp. QA3]EIV91483.1 acyl-CoA synthetase (AMP-forming)/AMP-acid ligase II [Frankia sp. QA3]